jgi:hypothetical protein
MKQGTRPTRTAASPGLSAPSQGAKRHGNADNWDVKETSARAIVADCTNL